MRALLTASLVLGLSAVASAAGSEPVATPTPVASPVAASPWTVITEEPAPSPTPAPVEASAFEPAAAATKEAFTTAAVPAPLVVAPPVRPGAAIAMTRMAGLKILAKAGWHGFSGAGWSGMPVGRYNGPATELTATGAILRGSHTALTFSGATGYFRGEAVTKDLEGSTAKSGFSGLYGDGDLRAEIGGGPIAFYAGAGGGVQQSSGWLDYAVAGVHSTHSHVDPTAHGVAGIALESERLFGVAELKSVSANVKLDRDSSAIGMGGNTFFVGLGTRW